MDRLRDNSSLCWQFCGAQHSTPLTSACMETDPPMGYPLTKTFFKDFIYLFLQRGRKGEREGEKHPCVVASQVPPTGELARNPGMCPDWGLNLQPFGSQAGTQSTEPHQPGLAKTFLIPILSKVKLCGYHIFQNV